MLESGSLIFLTATGLLLFVGYAAMFAAPSRTQHSPLRLRLDPVCGRKIGLWQVADTADHNGETLFFCSAVCSAEFAAGQVHEAPARVGA